MIYRSFVLASIILGVCLSGNNASAGELGVNVFGLSYHYESHSYFDGELEREYNQLNTGAGIQYILAQHDRHLYFVESGVFDDSMSNQAFYAAVGVKYFLIRPLGVGLAFTYLNSRSYGVPFAPLPVVTLRTGSVALNAVWMPASDVTGSGAIAFYATIHIWKSAS